MTEQDKNPWEKSSLEIKIIDGYEAQIVEEEGEFYNIEFHDRDMSIVEAQILKNEFKNWPHPIREGTCFGIISYYDKKKLSIGAWPAEKYWNPELVKE